MILFKSHFELFGFAIAIDGSRVEGTLGHNFELGTDSKTKIQGLSLTKSFSSFDFYNTPETSYNAISGYITEIDMFSEFILLHHQRA